MIRTLSLGLFLLAALSAVACDRVLFFKTNACPSSLRAEPDNESSGIVWGGTNDKVSAKITSVVVECLPVHHKPIATDKMKVDAFTDYEIAATASVVYKINDVEFFTNATRNADMDDTVVFEALSSAGVVLKSGSSVFTVVRGNTTGTVSAKIASLSDEEIRRVAVVRVRWRYGR